MKIDKTFLESQVKQVLADNLDIGIEKITNDKRFLDDLGIDSFKAMEFIFEIEDRLDIIVPENDRYGLRTVGDIIDYLAARLNSCSRSGI
jgi:acyl carrier protein